MTRLKYLIDAEQPLSTELCEFIGAVLGDGCMSSNRKQVFLTGDAMLDRDYYVEVLSPLCEQIFGFRPSVYRRRDSQNTLIMMLSSKAVFDMLHLRFGIRPNKTRVASIPEEISESEMLKACVRGLFDTDGGVGIDKRPSYRKPYVRLNFTSTSPSLMRQTSQLLTGLSIPHSVHVKNDSGGLQCQINGPANVQRFMEEIGFSNPRHLRRLASVM